MLAGEQIGPFAVEKEIGAGAMGAVYGARYTKTGLAVAIKIIGTGLDSSPTTLARFEREMVILKKLNHPNIVRLYATGKFRGKPFYAMEYVKGESLDHTLERRGRFTWEEVVSLGQQLCAALQHAHDQGVIHRDLKPANVMMMPDGTAKLTDFGIAKALDVEQLTATNMTVGTASYMSPEQCRGERNLTPKSDLYSLGVMFYELLTGRKPFQEETILAMFQAHIQGTFERPSRLVLEIPIWLDTLVCQLMEKDPDKRPRNADMVSQALARIQEKVSAQRSAGEDVVSTRMADRPRSDLKADEADREAARALKGGGKKRGKRKTKPLHQRTWVRAAGIVLLLAAVVGVVYLATRPPKPDKLFAEAQKFMATNDLDEQLKAREGPISKYFSSYPGRADEQAAQVHAWADYVDALMRERQLSNRMKRNMTPEGEDEPKARAAMRQEEAGNLEEARKEWQELEQYKEDNNPTYRATALLAAIRIGELKEVADWEKGARAQLDQARKRAQEFKAGEDEGGQAYLALQYEDFGDLGAALKKWEGLKDQTQDNRKLHPWWLLANKKIAGLKDKSPKGPEETTVRKELIQKGLDDATATQRSNPRQSQLLCSEIISLYDRPSFTDVAHEVAEARRLRDNPTGDQKGPAEPSPLAPPGRGDGGEGK